MALYNSPVEALLLDMLRGDSQWLLDIFLAAGIGSGHLRDVEQRVRGRGRGTSRKLQSFSVAKLNSCFLCQYAVAAQACEPAGAFACGISRKSDRIGAPNSAVATVLYDCTTLRRLFVTTTAGALVGGVDRRAA